MHLLPYIAQVFSCMTLYNSKPLVHLQNYLIKNTNIIFKTNNRVAIKILIFSLIITYT